MDDEKCFHVTIKGLYFDEHGAVLVLCFRIELEHLRFVESDECIGHEFVSKRSFASLPVRPQTRPLETWLR